MARGSTASQGRSARSSVNDIIPPPPTPDPNYKPKDDGYALDIYKVALQEAKTTEADWERNIDYQKYGAWAGKMTDSIKKTLEAAGYGKKEGGRSARREGGTKQDNYWADIERKGSEATKKEEEKNRSPGDNFEVGHRVGEVSGKDIVEKKKIILAEAKKELAAGNLAGDVPSAGNIKLSGSTKRFAGGASLEISATIPKDSPLGKAFNAHIQRMEGFDYRDRSPANVAQIQSAQDGFRATYGKELGKIGGRLNSVVRQFNYTRMNYLDDGFGTNFYGGSGVYVEGADGKKIEARYYI